MSGSRIEEFPGVLPPSPKAADLLGILVLDGSSSMNDPDKHGRGTKAEAVGKAVQELIERLKKSTRKQDFWLALVAFDNKVETRLQPTPVLDIDAQRIMTNPYLGGTTAIGDALDTGAKIAETFLGQKGDLDRSVIIMIMSDGNNNSGKDPMSIADGIKAKYDSKLVEIVSVAYGADADKETLKRLATDPNRGFCETDEAERLRNFFAASIVEHERPA